MAAWFEIRVRVQVEAREREKVTEEDAGEAVQLVLDGSMDQWFGELRLVGAEGIAVAPPPNPDLRSEVSRALGEVLAEAQVARDALPSVAGIKEAIQDGEEAELRDALAGVADALGAVRVAGEAAAKALVTL